MVTLTILVAELTVVVKIKILNLSRDLKRPSNQGVMWLCGYEPIHLVKHSAKFDNHCHCSNKNIIYADSYVISQDHMTLWVGAPYGKSLTCQVWCHKRYDVLVVEEEDSTYSHSLNFPIFVITFTGEFSERRNCCLQVLPRIMSSTDHTWFQTWLQ